MKSLIVTICIGVFSASGLSQRGEIRGSIKLLPDNIPLVGCPIWVENGKYGTVTDSLGFYSLSNLTPGIYSVHSQWIGTCEVCFEDVVVLDDASVELDLLLETCAQLGGDLFCPKCLKSDQVVPIVYGKPTKRTLEKANRGELRLGGCMVSECNANFYCTRDKSEFKY